MIYPAPKPQPEPKRKPKGVKRINRRRGGSMFPKRRDPQYVAYLREHFMWCLVRESGHRSPHHCWGEVQLCHLTSRGAGGYDQANIVPMCAGAHDEQHRLGIPAFQKRHGINLRAEAAYLWARYEMSGGGIPEHHETP